jgi:hypothetical protein
MKDNQHTQATLSTVFDHARVKLQEIQTLLTPYMPALTPEERRRRPKMGERLSILWKKPAIKTEKT